MSEYIFTSESVTEGHPDKVCDLISLEFIIGFTGEIPGGKREKCGNHLEHDLTGAKETAQDMQGVLSGWNEEKMKYRTEGQ
ncbi:MAG: S-adenosylmethionine synthetase N-terminal domain-containing protein [Oscillospiraceae bacterium]|nr:S-adenosylmethionine synthetase N-terminal domain-containing protein [Oscillospiraceae bacterium]